jgi:2-amino-4-hydroxy-6-hydroxymethyldihydropteridine diphosphokinase
LNATGNEKKHTVILGLGSNIKPIENLIRALELLCRQTDVCHVSSAWESAAVGSDGPDFLNAAVWIESPLSLPDLKQRILRPIEAQLGRVRTADKYAPRTIDIDILIFEGNLVDSAVWHQGFLAVPVAELCPDFKHPQSGESIQKAAQRLATSAQLKHRPEVLPGMWPPMERCN